VDARGAGNNEDYKQEFVALATESYCLSASCHPSMAASTACPTGTNVRIRPPGGRPFL
jgi:hypothetical protein